MRASVDSKDLLVRNLHTPLILFSRSWKNGSFDLFIIVIIKVDHARKVCKWLVWHTVRSVSSYG
jgi:hypothetical protein